MPTLWDIGDTGNN